MDTELARTFLAVLDTGTFIRAAERLNVSQTTVTARIKTLERLLGSQLFERGRHGASPTPEGQRFQPHASALLQVWERARHHVHLAPEQRCLLAVGGEQSLWSPLLLDWLVWMRRHHPDIGLRTHVEEPASLLGKVERGLLDFAVMYSPLYHPELVTEQLQEERLIMVTTEPGGLIGAPDRYVYVDWGDDFSRRHDQAFPSLRRSNVFVGLGPLALNYILTVGGAGYFRERVARPYLDTGRLHRVPQTPEFPYPSYVVWSQARQPEGMMRAIAGLKAVA
ncbi:LysR family transcriptional regulator [Marinobacter sp. X15-166B]|uniref:LysR family transcriptional regulator n=1 Tax=Marinobacter sp. X15-166B TaxID=1897620 RepID=UPI00085BB2CA|nr:LysR family transcriptional regulator [Marinobacter sp. X15-166B]OEY66177.1 LysR family transcriptional regulator [Marinobacter sp. X15-166B]